MIVAYRFFWLVPLVSKVDKHHAAWNNERRMLKRKNLILLGSVGFILLAVALVSLLNRTSSSQTSSDVRARAAVTKSLELNGIVSAIDETKGVVILANVYLSDENRTGDPQTLGTWIVTPPLGFNLASVSPGQSVKVGIDAKTFLVESHTVTAITIVPVAR